MCPQGKGTLLSDVSDQSSITAAAQRCWLSRGAKGELLLQPEEAADDQKQGSQQSQPEEEIESQCFQR